MIEQIVGMRADLLNRLDDASLIRALSNQEGIDSDRAAVVADLYREQGEIHAERGNPVEAALSRLRAMSLYLEVALANETTAASPLNAKIEALAAALEGIEFTPDTLSDLFSYAEMVGQYERGEKTLLQLARLPGMEAEIQDELQAYYQRLLKKNDADLAHGGLQRQDIETKISRTL
jgi:hypothetical protein